LPHTVDISSLSNFKRSLNRVDFSAFFTVCIVVVVFISSVFFMIYGQNVSASFLCLSCPALVLVLIMYASSCSADLSKINDDDDFQTFNDGLMDVSTFYLFKHPRQKAEATYMPVRHTCKQYKNNTIKR